MGVLYHNQDPFVAGLGRAANLGHHDSLRRGLGSPGGQLGGGRDQFAGNTVTGADEVDAGVATGRQVIGRGLLMRTKGVTAGQRPTLATAGGRRASRQSLFADRKSEHVEQAGSGDW